MEANIESGGDKQKAAHTAWEVKTDGKLSPNARSEGAVLFVIDRLEPGTTKNDDGREVTITKMLYPLLEACIDGKQQDDYIITREESSQVKDLREAWYKVTEAAGIPDLLFHDLRRTGARNQRHAGAAEGVIMKICGWKIRSVFERYAIVSQSDLKSALAKLEQQREEFSQSSDKVASEQVQNSEQNVVVN